MSYGGPKGINWEAALEFYLTPDSEGRIPSYQDVADKFGVSKKEVGLRAKKENWLQRRQNVYDLAEETYSDNRTELIKQTVQKHTNKWREAQDFVSRYFDLIEIDLLQNGYKSSQVKDLALMIEALKTTIEGERTALGLPNTINPSKVQLTNRAEVHLSPELIKEIDHLFEINKNPTAVN